MSEIIEIPVFKPTEEEDILLFKGQNYINDRTYDGFRFLEYELNEIQSIYFYLIEPFNQMIDDVWVLIKTIPENIVLSMQDTILLPFTLITSAAKDLVDSISNVFGK